MTDMARYKWPLLLLLLLLWSVYYFDIKHVLHLVSRQFKHFVYILNMFRSWCVLDFGHFTRSKANGVAKGAHTPHKKSSPLSRPHLHFTIIYMSTRMSNAAIRFSLPPL